MSTTCEFVQASAARALGSSFGVFLPTSKRSMVVRLMLPTGSIVRSDSVCPPEGRLMKLMPDVHVCQRPLSSWHCVMSPGGDGAKVNGPALTLVTPDGPPVTIGAVGGVVSRIQPIVFVVPAVPA